MTIEDLGQTPAQRIEAALGPMVSVPPGLTCNEALAILERAARGEIDGPRLLQDDDRTRRIPEGTLKATIRAIDAVYEFLYLLEEALKAADRGPSIGEVSNLVLEELTTRRQVLARALSRAPLEDPEGF